MLYINAYYQDYEANNFESEEAILLAAQHIQRAMYLIFVSPSIFFTRLQTKIMQELFSSVFL